MHAHSGASVRTSCFLCSGIVSAKPGIFYFGEKRSGERFSRYFHGRVSTLNEYIINRKLIPAMEGWCGEDLVSSRVVETGEAQFVIWF